MTKLSESEEYQYGSFHEFETHCREMMEEGFDFSAQSSGLGICTATYHREVPSDAEQIRSLRNATGCSLAEAREVLKLCKDTDVAVEYLRQYHSAVYRCRIVGDKKIPFTKEDYVAYAKQITEERKSANKKSSRK